MRAGIILASVALVVVSGCSGESTAPKAASSSPTTPSISLSASAEIQDGEYGAGRFLVDPARDGLWISMGCAGACAGGEEVWLVNGKDLTVVRRVKVGGRCSDHDEAPSMALMPSTGSLLIGRCSGKVADLVGRDGSVTHVALPFDGVLFIVGDSFVVIGTRTAVVDSKTGNVTHNLPVPGSDAAIEDQTLYVLDPPGRVTEVDTATWRARRTIGFKSTRSCIAISGSEILLREGGVGNVLALPLAGGSPRKVRTPSRYCPMEVDSSRKRVFLSDGSDVVMLAAGDFHELGRVSTGDSDVLWMNIDATRGIVYAISPELVKVTVT